jgi:hypothetical protein
MVSPNNPNFYRVTAWAAGAALGATALTSCGNALPPEPTTVPPQLALVQYSDSHNAMLQGCFRYPNEEGQMSVGTIAFTQESDKKPFADGKPFTFHPFLLHGEAIGIDYENLDEGRIERPANNSFYYSGETFTPKIQKNADGKYGERLLCTVPVFGNSPFEKDRFGNSKQFVTLTNGGGTTWKAAGPFNKTTRTPDTSSQTLTKVGGKKYDVKDYSFNAPAATPQATR